MIRPEMPPRGFQFSLRALLLVVAVAAPAIGLSISLFVKADVRDELSRRIKAAGGSWDRSKITGQAKIDFRGTRIREKSLEHLPLSRVVVALDVLGCQVEPGIFDMLEIFPAIEQLMLDASQIDRGAFRQIWKLRALRFLSLTRVNVHDDELAEIAGAPVQFYLQGICLDDTSIGDRGAQFLSQCKSLKYLSLSRTQVGDDGLVALSRIKSLRYLNLTGCNISAEALQRLKNALPGTQIPASTGTTSTQRKARPQ